MSIDGGDGILSLGCGEPHSLVDRSKQRLILRRAVAEDVLRWGYGGTLSLRRRLVDRISLRLGFGSPLPLRKDTSLSLNLRSFSLLLEPENSDDNEQPEQGTNQEKHALHEGKGGGGDLVGKREV